MKTNPQHLISWMKYLDIEYLDDELSEQLSPFDVNDPSDQDRIIELAIEPEFAALNDTSKKSLMQILYEVNDYPEADVRKLLARVGMPFREQLVDYKAFFDRVRLHVSQHRGS
jgi:hypothetical protein